MPVAEHLDFPQSKNPTEADLRTCFGRAYYGAYLFARDQLAVAGFAAPRGSVQVHDWLLQRLITAKDPALQDLGKRLRGFYKRRTDSDYVLHSGSYSPGGGAIAAQAARKWIDEFKAFIPKLGSLIRPG